MAQKVVSFRKISVRNPFPKIARNFTRDAKNLPKLEAVFTFRRAKSIMKKAPKKPKTVFGNIQPYGERRAKFGKYFWRKGLYSRPGHPPFHHGQHFNIRNQIIFHQITPSDTHIPHRRFGGSNVYAWRVGPIYRKGFTKIPVPQLHEYGGTIKISKRKATFKTRNPRITLRRREGGSGNLTYAERPYMRPSGKEARKSSRAKHGGSLKWLVKLGGLKGKREY